MSEPDNNDDKGFLARWSQRKQEARQPEPQAETPAADASPPPQPVDAEPKPEFDLSSLPKLEEITSGTDITGFLRKGVPEQLRNAALRKSWALDPAIRNYVNPAMEYAYDWNTPGGVPGSGELGTGVDVARMVRQIMGDSEPAAEPETPASDAEVASARELDPPPDALALPQPELATEPLRRTEDGTEVALHPPVATSPTSQPHAAPQTPVRRHGSAKPIV